MTITVKGFVTKDNLINNTPGVVADIYEISDIGYTYSTNKAQFYLTSDPVYSLIVFKQTSTTSVLLDNNSADKILLVVKEFERFLFQNPLLLSKTNIVSAFLGHFYSTHPTISLTNFNYSTLSSYLGIRAPNFITFTVDDIECSIWCSDAIFRLYYPDYEIRVVLPFDDFASTVQNPAVFLDKLTHFNYVEFTQRVEQNKNNNPTTHTITLNIPYVVSATVSAPCYFAFNVYGDAGRYNFLLRLALYDYLVNTLNLPETFVQSTFPSILNINEFFIIPRWEKMAIPAHVGASAILSQVTKTYNENFNISNYLPVIPDVAHFTNNTYNVPFDYNNILLHVVNGYYSESHLKHFTSVFPDFITVTSTHVDFSRMSMKTQRFVTLLENMLRICDSEDDTQLVTKMLLNTHYRFSIITRANVTYISILFDEHQIYVIPKYIYNSI